jgi:hypothetical protein
MARPVTAIQQEIRELTNAEKEEILTMLIAELDGPADEGVEAAWDEEVERRSREIDSGAVECIPAKDVFARVDKILGK